MANKDKEKLNPGSIFVCFICEKEFNQVPALKAHMLLHNENKEYTELKSSLPESCSACLDEESEISFLSLEGINEETDTDNDKKLSPNNLEKNEVIKNNGIPAIKKAKHTNNRSSSSVNASDSATMRKAMRYQQLLKARVKAASFRNEASSDEIPDSVDSDSFLYDPVSGAATVLSSEPDGFIIPSQHLKFSAPTLGKPKKSFKYRKDEVDETRMNYYLMNGKIKQEVEDDDSESPDEAINYYGRKRKARDSLSSEKTRHCFKCRKEFRSNTALRQHMKSHYKLKEATCPYCDEVFQQRFLLHQHLITEHEDTSYTLICPICEKVFTRPDSMKSHMVRMHEQDGGLMCQICNKNFPSQGQLEMHIRIHTGERPFVCEVCNKGFVQKAHLRTHLRTMHSMDGVLTTPCRLCNIMLDGRSGLKAHYTTVHHLTMMEYKQQVAKLRKECRIPEVVPSHVKVVDPSFRYNKVSVARIKGRGKGFYNKSFSRSTCSTIMSTDEDLMSDEFNLENPFNEDDSENDEPRRRDQEELNLVESAFKVAEQMDKMGEGSATILVAGENSEDTGLYYAIPVIMENSSSASETPFSSVISSTARVFPESDYKKIETSNNQSLPLEDSGDKYSQFSTANQNIESGYCDQNAENISKTGYIVKAQPLQDINSEQKEAVEMLTI